MAKVNLVQLEKNLNEVNYPVSRKDLVKHAEEKGADEGVLRALKQLPSKQYETPTEVSQTISNFP